MVTTLYLIRHGETEGGEIKRYKGSIDVPLSEKGIKQMEKVRKYLTQLMHNESGVIFPKAIYTSDLSRAVKSAEIISQYFPIKPFIVSSLRERNFGVWEGMSFEEIKEQHHEEFEAWVGNPLEFSPTGGESTLGVRNRVIKAVDEIINKNQGEHFIIVGHGGINRIILSHFLGIPLNNIFRIEQRYGAVNILEFWDKYPIVKLMNGG